MLSVSKIESFGLVDGPGIRSVIFFNGCKLRCKYCHNPEMWKMGKTNYTSDELVKKIERFKPYYGKNGGVTLSGGEPLLQGENLIDLMKKLKEKDINIALDTAGVGIGMYDEILSLTDLVLLDIKHVTKDGYKDLVGIDMDEVFKFYEVLNKLNKKIWIRQVIVPGINDNKEYLDLLDKYIKKYLKIENIERIEFLPYHTMAINKYEELGISYPLEGVPAMDKDKCEELYNYFISIYNNK